MSYRIGWDVVLMLLGRMWSRYEFIDFRNYLFFDLNSGAFLVDEYDFVYDNHSVPNDIDLQYEFLDRKAVLKMKYKYLYDIFKFW